MMIIKSLSNSHLRRESVWDGAGFPDRLHHAKAGLSTNAFAQKCGISESIFRKYLAGASVPGADKLVDIARVADVSLVWLATGQGEAQATETPCAPDTALLETVLEAVEAGLEQIGGALTPAKKAQLVAVIYGLYQSGESLRKAPVLELVKLAL